ncbi:MarR family winged helix-turn-helix transcriptional regulator [Pseudoprimorskyibacter insulae]|uniref:Transcriptional regulator SlyA n=1 Tax=Pseudoprimorskyibacter insulae TaxID=1695997 RepID=A0A2R8AYA0_9RHOB|nr:MarR family transcriptional regulator [Pseudoprimorskyibacter insulae]SPF81011.1 Transcriptional regulator SlyA [Pseudoprimorskyibacter insulae]
MPPPNPNVMAALTRFGIASDLFQSAMQVRLADHGLTTAQLSVLSHLARRSEPQRVTDIAQAVGVGQPAVTKMMVKFEGAGWVHMVADAQDRRTRRAEATDQGRAFLMQVQRGLFPELGAFLAGWSPEDLQAFTEGLTRFGQFLDSNRRVDD